MVQQVDIWDSMGSGKETPQIYQRMGVCARRSTWRGRPCGPDCTCYPRTQGLHQKSPLLYYRPCVRGFILKDKLGPTLHCLLLTFPLVISDQPNENIFTQPNWKWQEDQTVREAPSDQNG